MTPQTAIVLQFLKRLRARLRWLVFGQTISLIMASAVFLLSAAAASLSLGWSLSAVRLIFYFGTAAALVALALRGHHHWSMWATLEAHAHRTEKLFPLLRGRLHLAMQTHIEGAAFLIERVRVSVVELLEERMPADVHSSHALKKSIKTLAGAVVFMCMFEAVLPITPSAALAAFHTGHMPLTKGPDLEEVETDKEVLLGDISLRYTFPEHTRMTPIDVPNSDGAIHGPVGSLVLISARADTSYKAAALVINETEPEPIVLTNGRNVQFQMNIVSDGQWRLVFQNSEDKWFGTDTFPIQVDDDDPPIVTITEPPSQKQVPINQTFKVPWAVTDDFGIERVAIEVSVDGSTQQSILSQPETLRLLIDGRFRASPALLGLKSGDDVELRIVAYDNQPPALLEGEALESSVVENAPIGKRGESIPIRFKVMGPKLNAERLLELNQKLKALMIPVLADFLVDAQPPSYKAKGMLKWARTADDRLEPLQNFVDSEWGTSPPSILSTELVYDVLDNAGRLFRFTYSTYDTSSGGPQPKPADFDTFRSLHQDEVGSLEKAVYLIDMMLRRVAFRQVNGLVDQLADDADRLQRLLNNDESTLDERQRMLEQIERKLDELSTLTPKLEDGALKSFVESRSSEAQQVLDAAMKALQENSSQSQTLQEQLIENISQMADGVEEQRLRQESKQEEMMDFIKEVMEKLEAAQNDQEQLANALQTQRSSSGAAEQLGSFWEEVVALATDSSADGRETLREVGSGAGLHPRGIRYTENMVSDLDALLRAAQAREREAAIGKAFDAELGRDLSLDMIKRSNLTPKTRSSLVKKNEQIQVRTYRIIELLSQIEQNQAAADPSNQLAQQQQGEQDQLQRALEQLQQDVIKIEQSLPTADGTASEFAQQAGEDMGQALDYMSNSKGLSTEGMQRSATQNIQNTRDRLEQQLNEFMQMQQQMQQMDSSSGDGENAESSGGEDDSDLNQASGSKFNPLEAQKTPEEYRQELLEGMAADVPEEYLQQKKRYYEELVQQ